MKRILGLDLGVASIGWALVNEAENENEQSSIVKLGVRVNPLSVDEKSSFEKGKAITTNADRTLKRSMRRNNQRYKLRRENLVRIMKENGIIGNETILAEVGKDTTFETYALRAKAATEQISLEQLARVFLMINKKRGYKSSRKTLTSEDSGVLLDAIKITELLKESHQTPGQYCFQLLRNQAKVLPSFYRSDLEDEFDLVWSKQSEYYPELLTPELKDNLLGKNKSQTWSTCKVPFSLTGAKRQGKASDQRYENYQWRSHAVSDRLDLEQLAVVLGEINGQIQSAGGYLGNISDRSKILYFNHQTIGQYQYEKLCSNRHNSLTNEVFFRQDYIDEFNTIWETQAKYYPQLTKELKHIIADTIIFYQRPLKSQKSKLSYCEFESHQEEIEIDGKKQLKTIGQKVCPKSSPIFQEFRIWQRLNDIQVIEEDRSRSLSLEEKNILADELSLKSSLSKTDVLKLLFGKKAKSYNLRFDELTGNRTNSKLLEAYSKIIEASGHDAIDFKKLKSSEAISILESIFELLGVDATLLHFDSSLQGKDFENQSIFRLWHLLYSFEGDNSKTGNENLIKKIQAFGFEEEYARILAGVTFEPEYGSLSTRAIKKILPFMKEGYCYSDACEKAGYRHSKESLTAEELDDKILVDHLDQLPKDSLRNPVVEKIINQMINVVNSIAEEYGAIDEVRLEMARELKKNAAAREADTKRISKAQAENDKLREEILAKKDFFHIDYVSRNDILRYKLYKELEPNGYHTLYTDTYINEQDIFTNRFDIEHIIPQSRLFDDSFSNKTLETRDANIAKSNRTALDYVADTYSSEYLEQYKARVSALFKAGHIGPKKLTYLLMKGSEIPEDFLNRDLTDSQYIARKAKEILSQMVRRVVPTTGSITAQLREDWQLVNLMQELDWDKYEKKGLTSSFIAHDGQKVNRIDNWTKRNDHRHHAMDALTIAFTKESFIQYLNNLNARSDKSSVIYAIEKKELERDHKNNLRFKAPMSNFRSEAKKHMESILVSIKAKNKVTTSNVNISRKKDGENRKVQLTPRNQLHNETVYGIKENIVPNGKKGFKTETIFTIRKPVDPNLKIDKVLDPHIAAILKARLEEFGNDPKKAFVNLDKNPIWFDKEHGIAIKTVKIKVFNDAIALHAKRDNKGNLILDKYGKEIPTDFVQTSGNHHVAIFKDENGILQEHIVSYYEATWAKTHDLPVIDKHYKADEGWQFMFTMKQNEYFVLPNPQSGFDPADIDLTDPKNYSSISPHLFRVQSISSKDYFFRHHLETAVEYVPQLRGITWDRFRNPRALKGFVKVRVNHIGQIVAEGEY